MLNKKFEDATLADIEDLHFGICQGWKNPHTRNKFRKYLKKFYQWLEGYQDKEFPPRVKWIKLDKVPLVSVTEDDLIPFEDAIRISECALNLRDKALFSAKLDAGCRIGEVLPVRLGETKITENGAVLEADGKTGPGPLILTWATPFLTQWINNHPFKNIPDAPLFPDLSKAKPTQLSYAGARKAFKECVRRAGIKKRVWFHLLKHVSSTEDAKNGMPDSFRRYKHHWTPSSPMPSVYEHLSRSMIPKIQQETWNKIGIEHNHNTKPVELNQKMEVIRICMRCEFENPSDSVYCNRCGFALDSNRATNIATANEMADSLLKKLIEDPEKLAKLLALIDG
jgi:integrase/ribosomal protein L40E